MTASSVLEIDPKAVLLAARRTPLPTDHDPLRRDVLRATLRRRGGTRRLLGGRRPCLGLARASVGSLGARP